MVNPAFIGFEEAVEQAERSIKVNDLSSQSQAGSFEREARPECGHGAVSEGWRVEEQCERLLTASVKHSAIRPLSAPFCLAIKHREFEYR